VSSYVQDTSFLRVLSSLSSGTDLGAESGVNWDALPATALALLLLGLAYSVLIHYSHRNGLNDGYVWLEVVVGVAMTLAAASYVVGWEVVVALFILFAASGLFMAVGDIYRHVRARRAETRGER
jgi:heme A synthase